MRGSYRTELNVFDNDIRDLQTRVAVGFSPRLTLQTKNVGPARTRGIELLESWTISRQWTIAGLYGGAFGAKIRHPGYATRLGVDQELASRRASSYRIR